MKPTPLNKFRIMALASILPCVAHAAQIDVVATQTITDPSLVSGFGPNVKQINVNTTWTKDNIYILKDKVFVTNGATLTIEAGTRIYSTLDPNGAGTTDDIFGSLVITRGAKIQANGTAAEPIVFTTIDELEAETQTDYAFDNDGIGGANDSDGVVADAPTPATAGRWGGVVILGNAPVMNQNGSGVNIGEDRVEGFQPASSNDIDGDGRADVIEYGGLVAADDSGTFRYVSIRHGGFVFSGANEINGLTLGGVGSGTDIDHVEVYANKDDGIEFFGGTVNTSHMVMAFNQDDAFDIDQGYSGTNQFWFCVQDPYEIDGVTSGHDNGGEWDGYTGGNTNTDLASGSNTVIYNATFIGSGSGVTVPLGNDKGNNAIFIEDRFRGKIYNSLFHDFREDLIESAGDGPGTGLEFAHNTIGAFGGGAYTGSNASNLTYLNGAGAANTFFDAAGAPLNGNSNGGVNPMLQAYSRDGSNYLIEIDPRPASGSPLWTTNLTAGAPVATTYRGAFGSDNWAAGWTSLSLQGQLLGESAVAPPFADADGDGISDTLEATTALTSLGFSVGVNNVVPTNLFEGLYTETSILDLRTVGQTMVQKVGNNVTLTVPVEKSTGLNSWAPAGTMQLGPFLGDPNKEFYRLKVEGAN
jgi:trimeric autotransporter adhesin